MKHSVSVFFAWHGLESCWRLGVVEPDQNIVFYGLESCWRSGVVEPDQSIVFYGFERSREAFFRRVFCLAWARLMLAFGCFGQRSREAFFRRVFCLAEARLLLAFGCFGTEALFFMGSKGDVKHSVCVFFAWHGLESCWCFGLFESDADETLSSHRSESTFLLVVICAFRTVFFLQRLDCCWRSGVSEPKLCFLWVPKVTWSILSACFLLGMGSNLAGVSVFSNLTLTRLWAAIVRNPRSCLWLYVRFERFFAWQRFDCCWRSVVSEPKLCFLWVPKVTWSILSACFLLGMGSNLAGVSVFSNLTLTRLWAAIVRNPRSCLWLYVRFERFFAWQRFDCCWRSGVSEPKLCFLWVPKVTWSILSACFLLGMGSNLAGVSAFSNLTLTRLWAAIVRNPRSCLWLYVRFERFFAWQRLDCCWRSGVSEPKLCFLWVPKVTWSILSACFLLGMGSNLAGVSVFSNLTLTRLWAAIVRNPRSCLWLYVRFERFFAWQRLDCCWRSGVSEPKLCFLWVPKVTCSILSACFLLGMGSNLAGVSVFSNLTLTRLWAAIVRNPRSCLWLYVRLERFFAWQRLDCCWRSGVSEPKLCFLWHGFQRWREAFCLRVFCLAWARILLVLSVFSNLTLTRLWAAIVRNPRSCLWLYVRFERFFAWQRFDCCWRSGVSEPKLCFLWVPKVTCSILSACFLLGMGSNLAGVSVFSNLTLTRLWAAIVRNPRSCLWLYVRFECASSAPFLVYESRSSGLDPVLVYASLHKTSCGVASTKAPAESMLHKLNCLWW